MAERYYIVADEKEEALTKNTLFDQKLNELTAYATTTPAQIEGSATRINGLKSDLTGVVTWYTEKNADFARFFEDIKNATTDYYGVFVQKREEVVELRKKVEAERGLEAIRQEQVKSLENRNEANFHSSWMGLLRPLKEESRVGLGVAAAAFAIVALLAAFYLYRAQSGTPDFGFFRGGFRLLRKGRYFT
jgi:hypothetical protein